MRRSLKHIAYTLALATTGTAGWVGAGETTLQLLQRRNQENAEIQLVGCDAPACSDPGDSCGCGDPDCTDGGCSGGGLCAGDCDACGEELCCCDPTGSLFDNTELTFGGDSFASLGDFPVGGWNNSFGLVSGMNTAFALGQSRIRAQVGGSYGAYDLKGRSGASEDSLEEQLFLTGGIYKRSDCAAGDRISWGLVYDHLWTDNYGVNADDFNLGQIRSISGVALNESNEVGIWSTIHTQDANIAIADRNAPRIRAMNQANVYWKRDWSFGGTTMAYMGAMDAADVGDWSFGMLGRAPLSPGVALYGNFAYVVPSVNTGPVGDTEDQWNVGFGMVFYLGCKSRSPNISGDPGLPLLPVAGNSTFLITD